MAILLNNYRIMIHVDQKRLLETTGNCCENGPQIHKGLHVIRQKWKFESDNLKVRPQKEVATSLANEIRFSSSSPEMKSPR